MSAHVKPGFMKQYFDDYEKRKGVQKLFHKKDGFQCKK